MNEHPASRLLEQYAKRVLPPDLFLSVHKHVSSCLSCYQKCNLGRGPLDDYSLLLSSLLPESVEATPHLTRAELINHLRGESNEIDFEIAEGHLEICQKCSESAKQLGEVIVPPKTDFADARPHHSAPLLKTLRAFGWLNNLRPRQPLFYLTVIVLVAVASVLLIQFRNRDENPARELSRSVVNNETQAPPATTSQAQSAEKQIQDDAGNPPLDVVRTPNSSSSRSTLTPKDGEQRVGLKEEGLMEGLERLPPDLRQRIKTVLMTGRLSEPRGLSDLKGSQGTLLGESVDQASFKLLSPVGKVIRDTRPVFKWIPLEGASSYTVTVADAQLNEVATSRPLRVTEWRPSSDLRRGVTYAWQITAIKEGKEITLPALPAPPAKFTVLDSAGDAVLERTRRTYPKSHLALGILYAQAGLLDEAEREFKMAVTANPRNSVARKLLRSVRIIKARY